MSRLSVAALVLGFLAFSIGVIGPVLDPGVLREQLVFAGRASDAPAEAAPEKEGLRAEAERWLTRKLRERNDAAETARPRPVERGLFGAAAPYVLMAQFLIALAGLGLAIADWLRTRNVRANVMAGGLAVSALALPFVWSAIAIAVTIAVCLVVLSLVGGILG